MEGVRGSSPLISTKPFFYILRSLRTGRFYVGSTSRIIERFDEHNRGQTDSTRPGVPWELVYGETHDTLAHARAREREVKGWKSAAMIKRLIAQ